MYILKWLRTWQSPLNILSICEPSVFFLGEAEHGGPQQVTVGVGLWTSQWCSAGHHGEVQCWLACGDESVVRNTVTTEKDPYPEIILLLVLRVAPQLNVLVQYANWYNVVI